MHDPTYKIMEIVWCIRCILLQSNKNENTLNTLVLKIQKNSLQTDGKMKSTSRVRNGKPQRLSC